MVAGGAVAVGAPSVIELEAPGWKEAAVSRRSIVVALVVTLLISRLPEIIARDVLALDVPWMAWAVVAATVVLWLLARTTTALRPLERYLAVMVGVTLALAVIPLATGSAAWATLVPASTNEVVALLATRVLYAGIAVVVLAWT